MKQSKSKTFEKEAEISELVQWFYNQIETTDREVIQNTPPSYDVVTELNHKYIITVTKITDDLPM